MHAYYQNAKTFHFNHDICWLTGLHDVYHAGVVDRAHIVDKFLLDEADTAVYDINNQIKLSANLHRLFDSRLIWFDKDGYLHTSMDEAECRMYGIPEGARLVEDCLNDERLRYHELESHFAIPVFHRRGSDSLIYIRPNNNIQICVI